MEVSTVVYTHYQHACVAPVRKIYTDMMGAKAETPAIEWAASYDQLSFLGGRGHTRRQMVNFPLRFFPWRRC